MHGHLSPWEQYTAGVDSWHNGDLSRAADLLRSAVATATSDDPHLSDYLGALGGLLAAAGHVDEADQALAAALCEALRLGGRESLASVVVARYFLAEHFLTTSRPAEALVVIAPSIGLGTKQEGLIRMLESLSAFALNEPEHARAAAAQALETAASPTQRARIQERLVKVLGAGTAA